MKILIDLQKKVLDKLAILGIKSNMSRKKYIEDVLNKHVKK